MEKTDPPTPATLGKETSVPETQESAPPKPPHRDRWTQSVALFVILSAFWLLLSGRLGVQYFVFMVVTVLIVMWMNPERPFRGASEAFEGVGAAGRMRAAVHVVKYLGWLVWNVVKANIEVAVLILNPRLPIRPRLLTFRTNLQHPVAKVLVANSITLTPGTVTIDLVGDRYLVHAIVPESAGNVVDGHLQNVVAPVFGEGPVAVPECRWARSYREIEW